MVAVTKIGLSLGALLGLVGTTEMGRNIVGDTEKEKDLDSDWHGGAHTTCSLAHLLQLAAAVVRCFVCPSVERIKSERRRRRNGMKVCLYVVYASVGFSFSLRT